MIIPFPNKKYEVILADPAWKYNDKCHAGKRGAEYKYPCMTRDELIQLPVWTIADDNCTLFLWATMPMLEDALGLFKAWGFEYKTCAFTWVKTSKHGKEFIGMGNWTRANTEICLLGTRGKPRRMNASVRQVITAPVGQHSAKPPEVRDRIVQLMGDVPRIELFAREELEDWDSWGYGVEIERTLREIERLERLISELSVYQSVFIEDCKEDIGMLKYKLRSMGYKYE